MFFLHGAAQTSVRERLNEPKVCFCCDRNSRHCVLVSLETGKIGPVEVKGFMDLIYFLIFFNLSWLDFELLKNYAGVKTKVDSERNKSLTSLGQIGPCLPIILAENLICSCLAVTGQRQTVSSGSLCPPAVLRWGSSVCQDLLAFYSWPLALKFVH